MELSKDEKLFLLECMKMAEDEGNHLQGHYGSKISVEERRLLGIRLCEETDTPLEGRDWLLPELMTGGS